ncbi:ferredoxin [Nocardia sp. NBC_01503]|uniref:ferredoxin n=1 Tax=Nocardia sp. NBC_01503 TaxID=2975997 RepID=UPI002E7C05A5|nr:ferredoxin [Nocardia sp. NBC_01503]WTL32134.1 ferredoxin [Nocardia sp. NBC_01503]
MTEDIVVEVDQDLCLGSGLCARLAPEVFEFPDDVVELHNHPRGTTGPVPVADRFTAAVQAAELGCPAAAIAVHTAD